MKAAFYCITVILLSTCILPSAFRGLYKSIHNIIIFLSFLKVSRKVGQLRVRLQVAF